MIPHEDFEHEYTWADVILSAGVIVALAITVGLILTRSY